ncbi:MAG: hypothetical protein ABR582_10475 [Gemmatimonadaceae bacterium]
MTACRSAPVTQSDSTSNASEGGRLAGRWYASSSGLSVDLAIEQQADSVSGTGTYTLNSNSSLGCGGETIPRSGAATLNGKLSGTSFQGRMSFASTWTPPYLGTFVSPDSLVGHFMSVDRGGCPLVLTRIPR